MRLTQYTDYSLRVLIYLGYKKDETVTISEMSDFYKISRNHLMKVVHNLGLKGYIQTLRGKNGGLRLARLPAEISIGDVVRDMEPDFVLLECFDPSEDQCVISRSCALKSVLVGARDTFLAELDKYTLADVLKPAANNSPAFKSIPVVHG